MAQKRSSSRKRSNPRTQKKTSNSNNTMMIAIVVIIIAVVVIAAGVILLNQSPTDSDDTNENQNNNSDGNPIATIDTSMGKIKIELFKDKVPITAQNFIDHANDGYYENLIFHRVIPNFMIQGGDPNGDGSGGHAAKYHEGYGNENNPDSWVIPDEFHPDLSNVRGTISMANSGPDTGGSQFFISVTDNSYLDYNKEPLDYKHAVFGQVIEGMEVVDQISEVDRDSNDKPLKEVGINSITIEE